MQADDLFEQRRVKYILREIASKFNESPKIALSMMGDLQLISSVEDTDAIVHLLRKCSPIINKKTLGEFLAKPDNARFLTAMMAGYSFKGMRVDEALRLVMESFRLPGESQQIERILEAFALAYFNGSGETEIFSAWDSVHVLAYSIIMLNTDQHNKNYTQKRMTAEDFIKNNAGINNNSNFPREFLVQIYEAIKSREIILSEEHEGELGFSYQWNEVLKRCLNEKYIEASTIQFAKHLSILIWDPFMETLFKGSNFLTSVVFETELQHNSDILMALVDSTLSLAKIASSSQQIDSLINGLWQVSNISKLFVSSSGNLVPRYLHKVEAGKELVRCLVQIFKKYGEFIYDGWNALIEFLLISADSGILLIADALVSGDPISALHKNSIRKRSVSPNAASEFSLLSTISSYITGSSNSGGSPLEPTPSTHLDDYRGKAGEFLSSCRLEEIFVESRLFPLPSLIALLQALLSPVMNLRRGHRNDSLIMLIDIAVYCALHNRDRLGDLWPVLFKSFSEISQSAQADFPLSLREHATLAIGKLALKAAERPELQSHILDYLQMLCQIPPEFFLNIAEPCLAIIIHMLEAPKSGLLKDPRVWPHYFTILSLVSKLKHCAPMTLTILAAVTKAQIPFPVEFLSEYIELVSDFMLFVSGLEEADLQGSIIELSAQDMGKTGINLLSQLLSMQTGQETTILSIIARQCLHPLKEIRQYALSTLQKVSLSEDCVISTLRLLRQVYFPLVDLLCKDDKLNRAQLDEMQLRVSSLICKVFLFRIQELKTDEAEFFKLWRELIGKLLSFSGRGCSEAVYEGVEENIKNALSVLLSMELIKDGDDFLRVTFEIVDPIIPEVKKALYPAQSPIEAPVEPSISSPIPEEEASSPSTPSPPTPNMNGSGIVHVV